MKTYYLTFNLTGTKGHFVKTNIKARNIEHAFEKIIEQFDLGIVRDVHIVDTEGADT